MKVLLLKFEGLMVSFGDVAVDEVRPTARHPFKSMVVGLLANALGYNRTQGVEIDALQKAVKMASRIDRAGHSMVDYQTVLTNPHDPKKPSFVNKDVWTTRPVVLRTKENDKNPIQVYREYVSDTSVTIALAFSDNETLEKCAHAVCKPARPLFIGRKACPPTRPIFEAVIEADSLYSALQTYPTTDGQTKCFVRTEGLEEPLFGDACRAFLIRDEKDWVNGFHASERPVAEGMVIIKEVA